MFPASAAFEIWLLATLPNWLRKMESHAEMACGEFVSCPTTDKTANTMVLDGLDAMLLSGLGLSAIGLALLAHRKTAGTPTTAASARPNKPPPRPPGFLPVMHSDALFHSTGVKPLLTQIQQSLGFAPENYARDTQPLLAQVAEFVQLLPASESHHHANPGGLLTHLLEVAAIALLRCEEAKLPMGRATEEQLKHAARWRYGVLVAAVLHDIGKPLADVLVDVIAPRGDTALWNGLGGNLGDYGHAYLVRFPMRRDYQAHQRLPVMLLKSMVPASTMRWLSDDPELVPVLIGYLSGESDGGAIGKLVKDADMKSVADNLLKGNRTRFATARQVPLIERMMDGMRRMVAEGGDIALNREGAAGFCDGEDLWFVAGVIAEKTRAFLEKNEIRESGAAGLPTDNSRLFDVWLDYGAVRANAGAAIWRATITLDKPDGTSWTQTFTMLRFPLAKLFASPVDYPKPLTGRIEALPSNLPIAAAGTPPPDTKPAVQTDQIPVAGNAFTLLKPFSEPDVLESPIAPPTDAATVDLAAVPMDFDLPTLGTTADDPPDEYLDEADRAGSAQVASLVRPPIQVATEPTAPVVPAQRRVPVDSVLGPIPGPAPEIEKFMAWIQRGVATGELSFNNRQASVHFVRAGMLLITPKVFRDFLEAQGELLEGGAAGVETKRLQKLLQKSGYVVLARANTYLHSYRVTNAKNPNRDMVTGYLVPNPGAFFNPVPGVNDVLAPSSGGSGMHE